MNNENNNIGILDIQGINLNPLNNQPYSENYKQLSKVWSQFPAYSQARNIINKLNDHQVMLIISGTGSGKTVLLPKFVLHYFNYAKKIAITLPKRSSTLTAAEFAAETLDVELGSYVGYQFRGAKKVSENVKLLYATDGTIVSLLEKDPLLLEFDAVIIDEAHERKVQIDFLLYKLKHVISQRQDFRLIIMSATINHEIFENYFDGLITIDIGSKTNYPIVSKFLDTDISENKYVEKGQEVIDDILSKTVEGDILFFVTSVNETLDFCLNKFKEHKSVKCVEAFASMSAENQLIVQKQDADNRKLIVSTNVAESSLTIEGIKYVVESGYELKSKYDPIKKAKLLNKDLISQAQAKQRMGRAGRLSEGFCYHLYTENTFNKKMAKFPEPEIKTSNIYGECLRLMNLDDVETIDKLINVLDNFIEPPDKIYVRIFIETLERLNLIENKQITILGELVAETRLDPMMALALVLGYKVKSMREVALIVACLDVLKNNLMELFKKPSNGPLLDKFNRVIKDLKDSYGDLLVLYKIMNEYRSIKSDDVALNDWAYKYFLKINVLKSINDYYHKLRDNCYKIFDSYDLSINVDFSNYDLLDKILLCFTFGFRLNMADYDKKQNFYYTENVKGVNISKDSFMNFNKQKSNEVMFIELFGNNRGLDLNIVSKVDEKLYVDMQMIDIKVNKK